MTKIAIAALAAALLAAGCSGGGGSSPMAPMPTSAPAAIATPTPPSGATTFANVISPNGGMLSDRGEAFTLAAPVPVYNIGPVFQIAFTLPGAPTVAGVPAAVQVGTASSALDVDISNGTLVHWFEINNDASVKCGVDTSGNPAGVENINYFWCAGSP